MTPIITTLGLDAPNFIDDFNKTCSFMFDPRCITYNYKDTDPTNYNNRKWQIFYPYDIENILSFGSKRTIIQNLHEMPTIYF